MKLPNNLIIKQQIEAMEIFTKLETKNRYAIYDEQGKELYFAYEESNLIGRNMLNRHRPLNLFIVDNDRNLQLKIERKFYFMFADYLVYNANGKKIGEIKQKFKWFKRLFDMYDESESIVLQCISKAFQFWTFNVFRGPNQVGSVKKKWSGVGREMFTDADTFHVDLGRLNDKEKLLTLALAFAVDLQFFERKN
jgi:uncharacterized protein YxjI